MVASRILSDKGAEVFTVRPDDDLVTAARLLTEKRVGAAVVVDQAGSPVGVFSERDLARSIAEAGSEGLARKVSEAMSSDLVTAAPGASIDQLMGLMTHRRVRHIIIMEASAMVGLVSIGDVVKRKIAEAEAEADSLKAYIEGA
jgi:CBS domain-containing protein